MRAEPAIVAGGIEAKDAVGDPLELGVANAACDMRKRAFGLRCGEWRADPARRALGAARLRGSARRRGGPSPGKLRQRAGSVPEGYTTAGRESRENFGGEETG